MKIEDALVLAAILLVRGAQMKLTQPTWLKTMRLGNE